MEDLEQIGSCEELAPWIKPLTFGTAQLFDLSDQLLVREYLNVVLAAGADKEQFKSGRESYAHAERMYETVYDDMKPKMPFSKVVKAFRNLENARVIVSDRAEYLAGWLTPQQKLVLQSHCGDYGLHMDRCKPPQCGQQVRWEPHRFYYMHFEVPVITTIVNAGIDFKDLRLTAGGDWFWKQDWFTSFLAASLRTLHMTVGDAFKREGLPIELFDIITGLEDLLSLNCLEDLWLTLELDNPMDYGDEYSGDNEYFAATIFRVTEKASKAVYIQGLVKNSTCSDKPLNLNKLVYSVLDVIPQCHKFEQTY